MPRPYQKSLDKYVLTWLWWLPWTVNKLSEGRSSNSVILIACITVYWTMELAGMGFPLKIIKEKLLREDVVTCASICKWKILRCWQMQGQPWPKFRSRQWLEILPSFYLVIIIIIKKQEKKINSLYAIWECLFPMLCL